MSDCEFCSRTYPHYHGEMTAPNGNVVETVVAISDDPRAEVRDPDTGEVIFPAVKGPLQLIQGDKPCPPQNTKSSQRW